MKKLVLASFALSALAASFVVPAAHATPGTDPVGRRCGYDANSDPGPDAGPDDMVAVIQGGPLTWDRPFTLHCIIQVNSNIHNGTTNDTYDAEGDATAAGTTWVATVNEQANYQSGEFDQDYLCTEVVYAGGRLFWAAGNDGPDGIPGTGDDVAGFWTTNANTACAAATQFSTGPVVRAIEDAEKELDKILCPILANLHGVIPPGLPIYVDAEGDVFIDTNLNGISEADWQNDLFWDCPKYVDFENGTSGEDGNDGKVIDP